MRSGLVYSQDNSEPAPRDSAQAGWVSVVLPVRAPRIASSIGTPLCISVALRPGDAAVLWRGNLRGVYQGSTELSSRVTESHHQSSAFGVTKRLR
jgi:hypothetical protein